MALALSVVAGAAGSALAQTIEFRFVERTGQTSIAVGGDNVLSYAVQARVVGAPAGTCIGLFAFDIVMPGEADTRGTLARERISNNDRTIYTGAPSVNNTVGRGGIAASYTYLAGIGPTFNGVINFSSGTFTNTPENQEIGKVTGTLSGSALIGTPGMDIVNGDVLGSIPAENPCDQGNAPRADCSPDTWNAMHPWNSSVTPPSLAPVPTPGDTAGIDPAVAATYFGLDGAWVDVYRFRYTATDQTPRTITLTLTIHSAARTSGLIYNNGSWGAPSITTPATVTDLVIPIGTPGACCDSGGACSATVDTGCAGTFTAGGSCTPSPCASACCNGASCTVVTAAACSGGGGTFNAGAACGTGPGNPTTCCKANFDQMGGLEVKDIFEWINAWFMQDPRTDANESGSLELFDIFVFLQLWFAGCS